MNPRHLVAMLWGIVGLSVVALALAMLDRFSAFACLAAAGGTFVLASARGRIAAASSSPYTVAVLLLAMVPASVSLAVGPESILGGTDSGVYLAASVNLARTGSLWIRPVQLSELPSTLRPAFVGTVRSRVGQNEALPLTELDPGFTLAGDDSLVRPQFPPLYPAWSAVAFALGGLDGALLLPAILAGLGVVLVAAIGEIAYGRTAGLVAAALLALSPVELWYARETLAAMALQLLMLGTIYAVLVAEREGRRTLFLLAGLLSSLSVATKPTAALLLPALLAWAIHRRSRELLASLLVGAPVATLIAYRCTPDYTRGVGWATVQMLPTFLRAPPAVFTIAIAALLLTSALPLVLTRIDPRHAAVAARLALLGLAVWLVLVRPPLFLTVSRHSEDRTNILQLCWYLTPLPPLLALASAMWQIRAGIDRVRLALLCLVSVDTVALLINNLAPNTHPWLLKRYVVLTIPAMALLASLPIARALESRGLLRLGAAAALATAIAIPLRSHPRLALFPAYRGARALVESIDAAIPRPDTIVVEGGARSLATPLWLLRDRSVLTIWQPGARTLARRAIGEMQRLGRRVWVLSDEQDLFGRSPDATFALDLATLAQVKDAPADDLERYVTTLAVTAAPPLEAALPSHVDVGGADFGLTTGTYGSERTPDGRSYRWTGPEASVTLARAGDTLCVELIAWRPAGSPAADIAIGIDETHLLGQHLSADPRGEELAFPLPAGLPTKLTVWIRSRPFVPTLASDRADARELGVALVSARID